MPIAAGESMIGAAATIAPFGGRSLCCLAAAISIADPEESGLVLPVALLSSKGPIDIGMGMGIAHKVRVQLFC
jgi:hypothetical protein